MLVFVVLVALTADTGTGHRLFADQPGAGQAGLRDSAGELDDFAWTEPLDHPERWTVQPGWLSNPSPGATVTSSGQVACFSVPEPGRGMKWSKTLPAIAFQDLPYLVLRYRAENLNTGSGDYLVHLADRGPGTELTPLRLSDVRSDGQWHLVAVDLTTLGRTEAAVTIAVQVQADRKGPSRLWLETLRFQDTAPRDALLVRQEAVASPQPDSNIPLPELAWTARSSWLANPADEGTHRVGRREGVAAFKVSQPDRGMKWSADLPHAVTLAGYRYASLRYRAAHVRPQGDYLVCALGKPGTDGKNYVMAIPSSELVPDGRWHTLDVDLRPLHATLSTLTGLAMQVQASTAEALLEVAEMRLVNVRQTCPLADGLDWKPGAAWDGFRKVPIESLANGRSEAWRARLRLSDWFAESPPADRGLGVTAGQVPFEILSHVPDLACTPLRAKSLLRIPVGSEASEVYLLLLAVMTGEEEPAYGAGRLRAIEDVDRFRLRLEYADGTVDECLPTNVASGHWGASLGPQVLVAPADRNKRLEAVTVCEGTRQAAFGLAAVTVRTAAERLHPEAQDVRPLLRPGCGNDGTVGLASLDPPYFAQQEAIRLVELRVDGRLIPVAELEPVSGDEHSEARWYNVRSVEGLRLGLEVKRPGADRLVIVARLENVSKQDRRVKMVAPSVAYRLCERGDEAFYLVPKRGAALDNRDADYRERYCGTFPVQFLDTFSPACGRGLSLRTEDTECRAKTYLLRKEGPRFVLGVEYPEQTLRAGQTFQTPPAILTATDGDWHRGLDDYRQWLAQWYRPLSPRKPWFREIFNFRQRFLWSQDPLYDPRTGELHLDRALDEARREFGGIDYLHLFDWGNCGSYGRIYGRSGDYSPYDYLQGGRDSLRRSIAEVQSQGVPVGLYIEGYLLEERGKLGRQFGKTWQSIAPDGKGRYWPASTEMTICAGVNAWQEVQASTYAAKAQELAIDGMYLDEFGFAGSSQDCYSHDHGHPTPSFAVATERDCTRVVRQRLDGVRPGVALYSEETPVDVTSQCQDGSFTYAMSTASRTKSLVPLNLTRFAMPDFKTIEILYCDGPTGSWAAGVRRVFFNGEAIWLEGPAAEWFEPETLQTIRRCYAILRKHRDAFTTLRPIPLVPTEQGGVFANAFPAEGKTLYTLYNARRVTVRGPVLRLPHREGITYYDEWHASPAHVERDGAIDVIDMELDPCGVGCLARSGEQAE